MVKIENSCIIPTI